MGNCPAGNVGDGCSAICPCKGSNTCEAFVHKCRGPGSVGDPCHLTRPCGSGLTCEAGSHVCHAPGDVGDPCHLTRPCGSNLKCADAISAGAQICLPKCQSVSSATTARIKSHHYSEGADFVFDQKWSGGVVPYIVHCEMENYELGRLSLAMKHIRENTSISFKRYSGDTNYVIFSDFEDQAFWSIGVGRLRDPGWQSINLDSEWIFTGLTMGTAVHEIMHALGWEHTQNREDRGQYVTINWDNIDGGEDAEYQFKIKYNSNVYDAVQSCRPYNYGSVMHYPSDAFSKKDIWDEISGNHDKDTIVPKDSSKRDTIGNRDGLNAQDIIEIQEYYFGSPQCL